MKVISAKSKEEDMSQCFTVKKFWFEWFVSAIKARLVNCLEETRWEWVGYELSSDFIFKRPSSHDNFRMSRIPQKIPTWYVSFNSNFCHPFNIRMKRITLTGFYALYSSLSCSLYPVLSLPLSHLLPALWRLSNYETP